MDIKGWDSLLIWCMHRSPSSETISSTNSLCELLTSIPSGKFSHVLIYGDFNYPNVDCSLPSELSHCKRLILDTIQDLCVIQHVQEPTWHRNSSLSLLDLVFTYKEGMVSNIQHLPGLGLSHHVRLWSTLMYYGKYIQDNKPRYNVCQADFDKIWTLLETTILTGKIC